MRRKPNFIKCLLIYEKPRERGQHIVLGRTVKAYKKFAETNTLSLCLAIYFLPFFGFFGSLGFFFPKNNPKRSARRSLAYALFPMSGRGALCRPAFAKSAHGQTLCRFALPYTSYPSAVFSGLGDFFPKKSSSRGAG